MNLASLPMYDLEELSGATNALWDGLARHMRREGLSDVPDVLNRPVQLEQHWLSPNLLISQTCGYPLTHVLRGKVQLVGLPVYACDGCTPDGFYSSLLVVPASSNLHSLAACRQRRAVFNTHDSMSGLLALRHAARQVVGADGVDTPFFAAALESGGHRHSVRKVATGEADIAAIDAVTFALLHRIDPDLTGQVRVIGKTQQVPGLPFITSTATDEQAMSRLRAALTNAFSDPDLASVRAELLLSGISFPDPVCYDGILELEADARDLRLA
jgi:ABC-type phosphate/phosphonate transport system substrate-binding protein